MLITTDTCLSRLHYSSCDQHQIPAAFGCCNVTAQAFASDPAPLWKTDVRQFGYESFPLPKMEIPVRLSVAFIDDKHLAIAWITPDRTTRPSDAAHIVRVVVVDSSTGQKQVEKEWATLFTYRSPVLTGVSDAKFMICTDDALYASYRQSLDLVKEEQLPSRSTCRPSPRAVALW